MLLKCSSKTLSQFSHRARKYFRIWFPFQWKFPAVCINHPEGTPLGENRKYAPVLRWYYHAHHRLSSVHGAAMNESTRFIFGTYNGRSTLCRHRLDRKSSFALTLPFITPDRGGGEGGSSVNEQASYICSSSNAIFSYRCWAFSPFSRSKIRVSRSTHERACTLKCTNRLMTTMAYLCRVSKPSKRTPTQNHIQPERYNSVFLANHSENIIAYTNYNVRGVAFIILNKRPIILHRHRRHHCGCRAKLHFHARTAAIYQTRREQYANNNVYVTRVSAYRRCETIHDIVSRRRSLKPGLLLRTAIHLYARILTYCSAPPVPPKTPLRCDDITSRYVSTYTVYTLYTNTLTTSLRVIYFAEQRRRLHFYITYATRAEHPLAQNTTKTVPPRRAHNKSKASI